MFACHKGGDDLFVIAQIVFERILLELGFLEGVATLAVN